MRLETQQEMFRVLIRVTECWDNPVSMVLRDDIQKTLERFRNDIQPGDRIRAYDPPERDDCFVEGVVLDIQPARTEPGYSMSCQRYSVKVDRWVIKGEEMDIPSDNCFLPPMNGTTTILGAVTCSVVRIGGPGASKG